MTTTQWQTIRPFLDRISLQVKDLTSISASFVLAAANASDDDVDRQLASLQLEGDSPGPSQRSISDVLARGYTVKVNGSSWNAYILHVDDDGSEAVMILYGLRPGRQYEVELTIEQEEDSLRRDFVTLEDSVSPPADDEPELEETHPDVSISSTDIVPSRDLTPPVTPESASPRRITIEEERARLQLTKTSISQEHESLTAQLKMARKESQKTENATRAEIDALKKATEKQIAPDQRAKQRVLALQEAVKQTLSATVEVEAQTQEVEESLPRVRDEEAAVEAENAKVQELLSQKEAEVDQALRADKRRIADLQSELATVTNRAEKLAAKRDKLSKEMIPDFERQLAEVRKEIEEAEQENERLSRFLIPEDTTGVNSEVRNVLRQGANGRTGPRRSGPPAFGGATQPAPPFSQINAAAVPFYPSRQPGVIVRGSSQPSRTVNEFRPFDTPIGHGDVPGGASFSPFPPPISRPGRESQ